MIKQATFVTEINKGKMRIGANKQYKFDYDINEWIEKNVEPNTKITRTIDSFSEASTNLYPSGTIILTLIIDYTPKKEKTQ